MEAKYVVIESLAGEEFDTYFAKLKEARKFYRDAHEEGRNVRIEKIIRTKRIKSNKAIKANRKFTPKFPSQHFEPKPVEPEYVLERHIDHDYICNTCFKHIKGSALVRRNIYWSHANCRQSHDPKPASEMRIWQGYCIVEGCNRQAFIRGTECLQHL